MPRAVLASERSSEVAMKYTLDFHNSQLEYQVFNEKRWD